MTSTAVLAWKVFGIRVSSFVYFIPYLSQSAVCSSPFFCFVMSWSRAAARSRQPRDLALDAVRVRQALSGDDLSYSSTKNRESFVLFLCKHSSMTMPFVLSSLKFIFSLHPSV